MYTRYTNDKTARRGITQSQSTVKASRCAAEFAARCLLPASDIKLAEVEATHVYVLQARGPAQKGYAQSAASGCWVVCSSPSIITGHTAALSARIGVEP